MDNVSGAPVADDRREISQLDDALRALAEIDQRKASIVELRFLAA